VIDRQLIDLISLDLPGPSASTPVVVDADDGLDFVAGLERERIIGVGVQALEEGVLELPEGAAERLVARHDAVMSQTLNVEIMAIRVSGLLEQFGIRHRLLKGAALAHTVAVTPSERSFRDVDILVSGSDLPTVVSRLLAEGAQRLQPELRPGFDERFGKSVTMRLDNVEVDLHRLLAPGPFGVWMRPDDLFVLRSHVEIGGVDIPTFDATDHLIHACYHAALGQRVPVLSNLRDIVLLTSDEIDWERFDETVSRWRGTAVIQRSVVLIADRLATVLPERLESYRKGPVVADELTAITPYLTDDPEGRFVALAPATFRALPVSDRASFARAVGFPEGSDPVERARSVVGRIRSRK